MKKISITVFATSLLLATISTQAQAWTRYGGENSCGTVFQQKDEPTFAYQYKAWVFGFISAANELTQTTLSNAPDEGGIWQAIILHCQNNPLDNLYDATVEVWVQLLQRNQ